MKLEGLTQEDLAKNQDAVIEAIAASMGIPADQLNLDEIVVNKDGTLSVKIETPSDTKIPPNLAQIATNKIQNIDGCENAKAITSKALIIKKHFFSVLEKLSCF